MSLDRWIASLFISMFVLMLFNGCSLKSNTSSANKAPQKPIQYNVTIKDDTKEKVLTQNKSSKLAYVLDAPEKLFVVNGEGIAPQNTVSPAQAKALAKRAAVADAYRQMAEKLYGVKINAKDTVKNAALYDSRIVSQVNGVVKDATIVEHTYKDGLYIVRMELKMNGDRWKEIFAY